MTAEPLLSKSNSGVVDCDIHPLPKTPDALHPYLAAKWRTHDKEYGSYGRQVFTRAMSYPRTAAGGNRLDSWPPEGGPPGSDLDFMREHHLDLRNIQYGVLAPLFGLGGGQRNQDFGAAICTAQNEWQIEQWLAPEPRLRGSIMVTQDDTATAIKEIERYAKDRRFAQILVFPRSLEPLGRQRYWPIYEAAASLGIPIAAHVGGSSGHSTHGGGWASFYMEEHAAMGVGSGGANVASLILEGVPARFPNIKFVMIETSFTWVPWLGARMDRLFQRYASEVPQLTELPSTYLRRNFKFSTQPMDAPDRPDHLKATMDQVGWDNLMFASDYPHWDQDDADYAFPFPITPSDKQKLLSGNAKQFYGFD